MTTTTAASSSRSHTKYSTMSKQNEQQFADEDIQRFDADTIRNRYGGNWKNLATNVREVTQPDGSVIKEYFIEDPTLLEEIQPASRQVDPRFFVNDFDDEEHQPSKSRIAKIKAKFERNNPSNIMTSPATPASMTSTTTSHSNDTRHSSRKQIDDLYARHRRGSNESISTNRMNNESSTATHSSNQSMVSQNTYHRSKSIDSNQSKLSSFRRFNSADEADEEVSRIHRQGEELRRQHQEVPPMPSNGVPQQSNVQYEIVDEDGNPLAINGVQDLIQASGVRAREVPQPDGTVIKEYVIDDPRLLSQFRSQQQPSSVTPSYTQKQQQQNFDHDAPPPPPRIPLRPPALFRQGGSTTNEKPVHNIQQIHVLEPQRRYEYLTTNGQRIQYSILNSNGFNGQSINDTDIRELSNAINQRLLPTSTSFNRQPQPPSPAQTQAQFHPPKPWYPAVDLAQRQRLGSDNQVYPKNNNQQNPAFQQVQPGLHRSASSGMVNQEPYYPTNQQQPVFNQPQQDWNGYRYPNAYQQRPQSSEPFQSSAQFLPQKQQQQQQTTRSTYSPPSNQNQPSTVYQQSSNYPYQGQQQHGVRLFHDYNQQQTTMINQGNAGF